MICVASRHERRRKAAAAAKHSGHNRGISLALALQGSSATVQAGIRGFISVPVT